MMPPRRTPPENASGTAISGAIAHAPHPSNELTYDCVAVNRNKAAIAQMERGFISFSPSRLIHEASAGRQYDLAFPQLPMKLSEILCKWIHFVISHAS